MNTSNYSPAHTNQTARDDRQRWHVSPSGRQHEKDQIKCGGPYSLSQCHGYYPRGSNVTLYIQPTVRAAGLGNLAYKGLREVPGRQLVCSSTVCRITVGSTDREFVAEFDRVVSPLELKVAVQGSPPGSVTGTGDVNCTVNAPLGCKKTFASPVTINLTARPAAGTELYHWTGPCRGSDESCSFSLGQTEEVTAVFGPPRYRLRVLKIGNGRGTVTDGNEISCGESCEGSVSNPFVTVVATPETGFHFGGWTGVNCQEGNDRPVCKFVPGEGFRLDQLNHLTAAFYSLEKITITLKGTGSGTLAVTPTRYGGFTCVDKPNPDPYTGMKVCTGMFPEGTKINIIGNPDPGSRFEYFETCIKDYPQPCEFSAPTDNIAWFQRVFPLQIARHAGGRVKTDTKPMLDCGPACEFEFAAEQEIVLTATPGSNHKLGRWEGVACKEGTQTEATCTIKMDRAHTVGHIFTRTHYNLRLSTIHGSVTVDGVPYKHYVVVPIPVETTSVALNGNPDPLYQPVIWGEDCQFVEEGGTCYLSMTRDRRVTATFFPSRPVLSRAGSCQITTAQAGSGTLKSFFEFLAPKPAFAAGSTLERLTWDFAAALGGQFYVERKLIHALRFEIIAAVASTFRSFPIGPSRHTYLYRVGHQYAVGGPVRYSNEIEIGPTPGMPTFVASPGNCANLGSLVKAFGRSGSPVTAQFTAYPGVCDRGTNIAIGDVDGDGYPEIITGAGNGSSLVKIFDKDGILKRSFEAFSGFGGGVFVAAADTDGDGDDEIIVGAGANGGPDVRVFDGESLTPLWSFRAYAGTQRFGVRVAGGDVNGDGVADIITGLGPGGPPHVKVWDGASSAMVRSFFAYAPSFTGGVWVAAGDVNGDGKKDIITGADAGGGPQVRAFDAVTGERTHSFFAFASTFTGGARVASADLNDDGKDDFVVGAGPNGGAHVRVYHGESLERIDDFYSFAGGVGTSIGVLK